MTSNVSKSLILGGNCTLQNQDGTLIRSGVGLTMAQFIHAGGKVVTRVLNAGYTGPNGPKDHIQDFFSEAERRERALDDLYKANRDGLTKQHKQLLRHCHNLLKHALPECTVTTQLVTFKILVAVITRYPGIRPLFHHSKCSKKTSRPAASQFENLWNRPHQQCGEEWTFYRDFALYCLSDCGPPTRLIESELPSRFGQLKLLEDNWNKDPIENLLSFCSADSPLNSEKLCAIRYLAGILDLPKVWRLKTEEGTDIGKRLFGFLSRLCETIFQLIRDMEPSGAGESEDSSPLWTSARGAVDILAFTTFGGFLQLRDPDELPCPSDLPSIVLYLQRPEMDRNFPKASSRAPLVGKILNWLQDTGTNSLHVSPDAESRLAPQFDAVDSLREHPKMQQARRPPSQDSDQQAHRLTSQSGDQQDNQPDSEEARRSSISSRDSDLAESRAIGVDPQQSGATATSAQNVDQFRTNFSTTRTENPKRRNIDEQHTPTDLLSESTATSRVNDSEHSEYEAPNQDTLLMFPTDQVSPSDAQRAKAPPFDDGLLDDTKHGRHSRASSGEYYQPSPSAQHPARLSPQPTFQPSPRLDVLSSFGNMSVRTPNWGAQPLPKPHSPHLGTDSQQQKPQSPPRLTLPPGMTFGSETTAVPKINAPNGKNDDGVMFNIVPATPVGDGDPGVLQHTPFRQTLETFTQGVPLVQDTSGITQGSSFMDNLQNQLGSSEGAFGLQQQPRVLRNVDEQHRQQLESFTFGGAAGGDPIRRTVSDSLAAPRYHRPSRSEEIRPIIPTSTNSAGYHGQSNPIGGTDPHFLFPPSSHSDFIQRQQQGQFLHPNDLPSSNSIPGLQPQSVSSGLGHIRRASSGSRSGRGAEIWGTQADQLSPHSNTLGVRRMSPYPTPNASPRVNYSELDELNELGMGNGGGLGLGLGVGVSSVGVDGISGIGELQL